MDHRGRIQAQGGNVERSRNWDQATPLFATTAFAHLESLKAEIGKRETELRSKGFIKARKYIDNMRARGGTEQAPPIIKKSFPQPSRADRGRVDIEVYSSLSGHCFLLGKALRAQYPLCRRVE
jgi:hypothetical protein